MAKSIYVSLLLLFQGKTKEFVPLSKQVRKKKKKGNKERREEIKSKIILSRAH
jgi:hypothetical protein